MQREREIDIYTRIYILYILIYIYMFGLHSALFLSSASHAVDALAKGANKTGNFRSDHQMAKT